MMSITSQHVLATRHVSPVTAARPVHRRCARTVVCVKRQDDTAADVGAILKSTTAAELMTSARHVFDDAESQLRDYCNVLQQKAQSKRKRHIAAAKQCQSVLEALQQRRMEAERSCQLEASSGVDGGCKQLDRLEQLLRQLAYGGGGPEVLCRVLAIEMVSSNGSPTAAVPVTPPQLQQLRTSRVDYAQALRVFDEGDRSKRGALDKEQLLWALSTMGCPISHAEVNRILGYLDVHGFVSYDTFLAILETHAAGAPNGSDSVFLRSLSHDRPSWWSDTPHALDSIL